jgi:hypothetical protein
LGLVIKVAPSGPTFRSTREILEIDVNTPHPGQIDHKPLVAHGIAHHTVTAPPNRCQQMSLTSEIDGGDYVCDARASHD